MIITFFIFACVVVLVLVGLLIYLSPVNRRITTVPGPDVSDEKGGNILDISQAGSLHQYLVDLHEKFGPVVSFWYGAKYCVSLGNAAYFKFSQHFFDRPKGLFEFVEPLIGKDSIQFANGRDGKNRHKLYSDALSHSTCVKALPDFNRICRELTKNWANLPREEHIPLHDYMMALAIKLLSETQFGGYFKNHKNTMNFHRLYENVMSEMEALMIGTFSEEKNEPRYRQFIQNLDKFKVTVQQIIDEHKAARHSGDYVQAPILDTLLDHSLSDEVIISDAISMFVGGFHTTGNFLTWALYYLAIEPEVQNKMAAEIAEVLDRNGKEEVDENAIKNLKYTKQVLDETLRCSVTATFGARVEENREIKIGRHTIPPGTPIIHAIGVTLQDPNVFPEPQTFDPDRFSEVNVKKQKHASYFSPFGIGQRRCPGYKFSYYEAYVAIVSIIRQFKIRPAFDSDYFIEPKFGFVTKPETEIWIKIDRRRK